jgi:uncharacterized protein YukE
MPQVYVEPEKLRDFAKQLRSFSDVADQSVKSLKGEIARLGGTWRDQEFDRFVEQFGAVQALLKKFVEETKRTTPLLEKDASIIEESQRLKPSV